jgi:hypothetical protein
MPKRLRTAYLVVILTLALMSPLLIHSRAGALQTSGVLRIYGAVNRPLNLTYSELLSFPMVSEEATLECVANYPRSPPAVLTCANWTGIPLFYLLTLAEVNSSAYKVVTIGSDGFSSDLLVGDALSPTIILALEENGTTSASMLPRLVVPNRWGYKWVGDVDAIDVVNYNYLGTDESRGYSDIGAIPGDTVLPSINPPLQELNVTLGNSTFNVGVFTNVSINHFDFDYSQKKISLNVTSGGFADFILPHDLKGPYNVSVDSQAVNSTEADLTDQSYLYVTFPNGLHNVETTGTKATLPPEFTLFMTILSLITATALIVIIYKRERERALRYKARATVVQNMCRSDCRKSPGHFFS